MALAGNDLDDPILEATRSRYYSDDDVFAARGDKEAKDAVAVKEEE